MNRLVRILLVGVLVVVSVVGFSPAVVAQHANCAAWQSSPSHQGIDFMVCVYDGGGSGYERWRNRYDSAARIGYQLYFGNGTSFNGSTSIPAHGESGNASCWGCGTANTGGLMSWSITRFALQGDPGYF